MIQLDVRARECVDFRYALHTSMKQYVNHQTRNKCTNIVPIGWACFVMQIAQQRTKNNNK